MPPQFGAEDIAGVRTINVGLNPELQRLLKTFGPTPATLGLISDSGRANGARSRAPRPSTGLNIPGLNIPEGAFPQRDASGGNPATQFRRDARVLNSLRREFDDLRSVARRRFGRDEKSLKQRFKEINEEEREAVGSLRSELRENRLLNNPVSQRARAANALKQRTAELQGANPGLSRREAFEIAKKEFEDRDIKTVVPKASNLG